MEKSPNGNGTTTDSKQDINYSTRYDDREIIIMTENAKLDWLSVKIEKEIDEACLSGDILKLERLISQYHSDGIAAQRDENIAYWIRYVRAYERGTELINAAYLTIPEIDFSYCGG